MKKSSYEADRNMDLKVLSHTINISQPIADLIQNIYEANKDNLLASYNHCSVCKKYVDSIWGNSTDVNINVNYSGKTLFDEHVKYFVRGNCGDFDVKHGYNIIGKRPRKKFEYLAKYMIRLKYHPKRINHKTIMDIVYEYDNFWNFDDDEWYFMYECGAVKYPMDVLGSDTDSD